MYRRNDTNRKQMSRVGSNSDFLLKSDQLSSGLQPVLGLLELNMNW